MSSRFRNVIHAGPPLTIHASLADAIEDAKQEAAARAAIAKATGA